MHPSAVLPHWNIVEHPVRSIVIPSPVGLLLRLVCVVPHAPGEFLCRGSGDSSVGFPALSSFRRYRGSLVAPMVTLLTADTSKRRSAARLITLSSDSPRTNHPGIHAMKASVSMMNALVYKGPGKEALEDQPTPAMLSS